MGLPDPRTQGSRNPGATNVLRIGGRLPAAITLLGDVLKGFIPVFAATCLKLDTNTIALVMTAAFLGHLYPVFFRFEGGKGVATLIGCLLGLSWPAGWAFIFTWLLVAMAFRYSSLASLSAALIAPLYVWYFTDNSAYYLTTIFMSFILIFRHRVNIENLSEGKESMIGKKAKTA
jgi:glycerol-3-phosphate acyltransferase PlsY